MSRRLVACLLLAALALAPAARAQGYQPPALHSMVMDPGHVLTSEQQEQLATRLGSFRKETGFAVVVFFPVSLEGKTVEDVAHRTFNRWKIGDAGKNNGVLLLVAMQERKVRIETGLGVEAQLTDVGAAKILREQVIPQMKASQPYRAVVDGTDAIAAVLRAPDKVGAVMRTVRFRASGPLAALLVAALASTATADYQPPELRSMVEDPGHVLTAEQQAQLANRLGDFRNATGFAVVVFFPVSLEGQTVEDVAYQTFNRWKVGEAGTDNGVLLVLATQEHKVRIETGKGVGGQLTDIESGRILREQVIPQMKANQPYQAAVAGTDAIVAALRAPSATQPAQPGTPPPPPFTWWDTLKQWTCSLLCLVFSVGFIYLFITKGIMGKGGGGGGRSGGWGGGGSSGGGGGFSGGYSGGGGSSGGGGASGSY